MKMINKIIGSICTAKNINIKSYSKDWIMGLEKDNKVRYIIGYDFELNSSAVNIILKDKSATSDILEANNIPHVEHKLFISPKKIDYVGNNGNWNEMVNYAKKHDYKLVCKNNYGTGGLDILKIDNQSELELAIQNIFERMDHISLSPYYNLLEEYRAIYLDGKIKLIYRKQRPFIISDGIHSLKELLVKSNYRFNDKLLNSILECKIDLEKIYPRDEEVLLSWKHNLGLGAEPIVVDDKGLFNDIEKIINSVTKVINIKFASFDIVKINNKLMILEINAGVMMDSFASRNQDYYTMAHEIYDEAVDKMFESEK